MATVNPASTPSPSFKGDDEQVKDTDKKQQTGDKDEGKEDEGKKGGKRKRGGATDGNPNNSNKKGKTKQTTRMKYHGLTRMHPYLADWLPRKVGTWIEPFSGRAYAAQYVQAHVYVLNDLSPVMNADCRKRYPKARVENKDFMETIQEFLHDPHAFLFIDCPYRFGAPSLSFSPYHVCVTRFVLCCGVQELLLQGGRDVPGHD